MESILEFENLMKDLDEKIDNYRKKEAVKQKLREAEEINKPKRVEEDAKNMLKEVISLFQKAPIEQLSKGNFYVCVINYGPISGYYKANSYVTVKFECNPKYFDESFYKMIQLAETLKLSVRYSYMNEGTWTIKYNRDRI